jgi:hypothetical protein
VEPPGYERTPDDIDAVLDDVFGAPSREGTSAFDVVLLVAGGGLLLAGSLSQIATGWAVAGAAMVLLGLVLPVRDLWRAGQRRRAQSRLDGLLAGGLALEAGHESTTALVASYQRVVTDAYLPADALEAAHLAVMEVARLLQGHRPSGPAEIEYVESRVRALTALEAALAQAGRVDDDASIAAVRAAEELDAVRGPGSLARLDAVRATLQRGRG